MLPSGYKDVECCQNCKVNKNDFNGVSYCLKYKIIGSGANICDDYEYIKET